MDDKEAEQHVPERERQTALMRDKMQAGDSEQQLMLPFADNLAAVDPMPVVKSISHDDPIRRIMIFLAQRAAAEDHLAWEAEHRRSRGDGGAG